MPLLQTVSVPPVTKSMVPVRVSLSEPTFLGDRALLILLRSPGREGFTTDDIAQARQLALVALAAAAAHGARIMQSELSELRRELELLRASTDDAWRRAYTDELTGLPNRAMIQRRVDQILEAGSAERFALAFIDLDNFKHINDYYNHAVGDALLINVTRRIGDLVRQTDMLARISGDEFLLLVHPVDNDANVRAIVDTLLEKLKRPFHVEGFEMFTSASIGVSIHPEHGRSYEELRRNADSAMYRAMYGRRPRCKGKESGVSAKRSGAAMYPASECSRCGCGP